MSKVSKRKSGVKASTTAAASTPASEIPVPFIKIPITLEPFLPNLAKDHFYIISLDKHDRAFKRRLFAVPLLLNIFLTVLVIYRVYKALPTYFGIFFSVLGYDSPYKVDVQNNPATALVGIGIERTFMFLGDFILLRFIGIWPSEFFLGRGTFGGEEDASPVTWRRAVGFRDDEIIVRRSRRWDHAIFHKENIAKTGTANIIEDVLLQGTDSKTFNERLTPAVNEKWIKEKTGYQMLDKSWDLYFFGMIEAHARIDKRQNKMEDFQASVLVYTQRWGWLIWQVWKDHEQSTDKESSKKLQLIKDALTTMQKEHLFFRSIEIIQHETSRPLSSTSEKQQTAIYRIREEFEQQGVDFDEFWRAAGGIESMPGLEVSS